MAIVRLMFIELHSYNRPPLVLSGSAAPMHAVHGTTTRMPLMSVFVISNRFLSLPSKHAYSTGT